MIRRSRLFIFLFTFIALAVSAQSKDSLGSTVNDSIVNFAKQFIGKPYKYGCSSPAQGFDCSGFTNYIFAHFGYIVPRSACDYMKFGDDVGINDCQPGDIIVFRGTHPKDKHAGHVGIVISGPGEPLKFIHASSSAHHRGVVITDYGNSNYPARFIRICRVIK